MFREIFVTKTQAELQYFRQEKFISVRRNYFLFFLFLSCTPLPGSVMNGAYLSSEPSSSRLKKMPE